VEPLKNPFLQYKGDWEGKNRVFQKAFSCFQKLPQNFQFTSYKFTINCNFYSLISGIGSIEINGCRYNYIAFVLSFSFRPTLNPYPEASRQGGLCPPSLMRVFFPQEGRS
jgi:hypothetical protein